MAADECTEDFVSAERDDRIVVLVTVPIILVVVAPAVVEALFSSYASCGLDAVEVAGGHYHAEIPELHALVFAVTEDVACER